MTKIVNLFENFTNLVSILVISFPITRPLASAMHSEGPSETAAMSDQLGGSWGVIEECEKTRVIYVM
ncbi:8180_t:CDS:2 [Gigaspora rosea]|nr:8180_t:CDS:2 [Gigaspora rosea]